MSEDSSSDSEDDDARGLRLRGTADAAVGAALQQPQQQEQPQQQRRPALQLMTADGGTDDAPPAGARHRRSPAAALEGQHGDDALSRPRLDLLAGTGVAGAEAPKAAALRPTLDARPGLAAAAAEDASGARPALLLHVPPLLASRSEGSVADGAAAAVDITPPVHSSSSSAGVRGGGQQLPHVWGGATGTHPPLGRTQSARVLSARRGSSSASSVSDLAFALRSPPAAAAGAAGGPERVTLRPSLETHGFEAFHTDTDVARSRLNKLLAEGGGGGADGVVARGGGGGGESGVMRIAAAARGPSRSLNVTELGLGAGGSSRLLFGRPAEAPLTALDPADGFKAQKGREWVAAAVHATAVAATGGRPSGADTAPAGRSPEAFKLGPA